MGYSFPPGVRNVTNESFTEYGSRAGVWRLLDILDHHGVKATFFACAVALERNLPLARAVSECFACQATFRARAPNPSASPSFSRARCTVGA